MRYLSIVFAVCGLILASCASDQTAKTGNKEEAPAAAPVGPPQSRLDEAGTKALMEVVNNYYDLKNGLVATDARKADAGARALVASAESLKRQRVSDSVDQITVQLDTIINASNRILSMMDESTEVKRIHFEKVSDATYALVKAAELKNAGIYRQYCPMAFNDKGAYWLAAEEKINNPYFGKKMLTCGEVVDSLK
jgi:hypothetical protein